MSDNEDERTDEQLDEVQAYYDRIAPRLRAVEQENWHLQSRMSCVLATIDEHGPGPGGRVLDVGCGGGFLLEELARRGYSGVGIDLSPESVDIARTRLAEIGAADRLDAMVGSAYEPPEGPYDLVTLTDVLEHLEDPRACLRALREQMNPGALLVISTPNRRSLPGARRWAAEHGVPGIKLSLAPIDNWQSWVDLESHAGQKKFSKSRKIVVDTTAPDAPALAVTATRTACTAAVTGPGEATRLQVAAVGTGAASDWRDLPAKGTFTWTWNRRRANGAAAPGPTVISATVSDAAGNRATARRICMAARKAKVTP